MNRTQTLAIESCGCALANRYFGTEPLNEEYDIVDFEDMDLCERGIKALGLDVNEVLNSTVRIDENGVYSTNEAFSRYLLDDDFTLADLIDTAN